MANRREAVELLRTRQPFTSGNLKGYYEPTKVYPDGGTIYVVKSYALPIAVFDGDTWHILDSMFVSATTSKHQNFVQRVIGTNDAYSEYPRVPTKASMVALIGRLTGK